MVKKYTNLFQRPFMNRNKHQVKMAKKNLFPNGNGRGCRNLVPVQVNWKVMVLCDQGACLYFLLQESLQQHLNHTNVCILTEL